MNKLIQIAAALKAPKAEFNAFGKYSYRTLANINEALKPILVQHNCSLVVTDAIEMIGERYYIKATASLFGAEGGLVASASSFARESESKKGMDDSQITGTASSYARKYAIGGLFMIDDSKDADALNTSVEYTEPAKAAPKALPAYSAEKFQLNKSIWQGSIIAGKILPTDVIEKLQKQFTLTKTQINEINEMGQKK